tara:strand:- start:1997 stop:2170 length:174 start_codon:yes stop_codon:yes gene_type:complete
MADISLTDYEELQHAKAKLQQEYSDLMKKKAEIETEMIELQGQEKYMIKKDPSLRPE